MSSPREEEEQLIQRNRQQRDVGNAQNTLTMTFLHNLETAVCFNVCILVYHVAKVLGIGITLLAAEDTECDDQPLLTWVAVYSLIELLPIILSIWSVKLRRERIYVIPNSAQCLRCVYGSVFLAWFILGNVWYFSDDNNCDNDAPVVNDLTLALLILSYISICTPCLLCLILCFCVSGVALFQLFRVEAFNPDVDSQAVECALQFVQEKKRQWNRATDNPDICPICQNDFNHDEAVVTLRCNHTYHVDCLNQWIRINPICPSCRQDIVLAIQPRERQPAEEVPQQHQNEEQQAQPQEQQNQREQYQELVSDSVVEEEKEAIDKSQDK